MSKNPEMPPSPEVLNNLADMKIFSPSEYWKCRTKRAAEFSCQPEELDALVDRCIEAQAEDASMLTDEGEFARLASMSATEYEQSRTPVAKRLGMRVTALDRAATKTRTQTGEKRPFAPRKADPCPYKVDGAAVLDEVAALAERYLHLPQHGPDILALWATHTYCFSAQPHTPRLAITSATKGCGKTSVLDFLSLVCQAPLSSESVTPAAVFRLVEKHRPTLLLDELDNRFSETDGLRRILNSGWQRGGMAVRVEFNAGKGDVVGYSTHAPAALAAIGHFPATLEDRSIQLRMEPALPGELKARLRTDKPEEFEDLRSQLARFAEDAWDSITDSDPEMSGAYNRTADRWRILIAIADVAGGEWPNRAQTALAAEIAAYQAKDQNELCLLVLADVCKIFKNEKKLSAKTVVEVLIALEDRPWGDWRHGKPLTPQGLGKLLQRFGIKAKQFWVGGANVRRYTSDQFTEARKRYLAHKGENYTAIPLEARKTRSSSALQTARNEKTLAVLKPLKPTETVESSAIAHSSSSSFEKEAEDIEMDGHLQSEKAKKNAISHAFVPGIYVTKGSEKLRQRALEVAAPERKLAALWGPSQKR